MGTYMVEKFKTGRKNNLGNIFVTQSGLDAERAGYGALLNEACPMNIFLSNPKIQTATYQQLFGLNEKQAERIVRQRPRQDVTISTPQYFKTVALRIDDDQDRLTYSNDPNSNPENRFAASGSRRQKRKEEWLDSKDVLVALFAALALGLHAQQNNPTTESIVAHDEDIIPLHASMRETTLIVLPAPKKRWACSAETRLTGMWM